jgi:hypothetical protein
VRRVWPPGFLESFAPSLICRPKVNAAQRRRRPHSLVSRAILKRLGLKAARFGGTFANVPPRVHVSHPLASGLSIASRLVGGTPIFFRQSVLVATDLNTAQTDYPCMSHGRNYKGES